MSFKSKRLNRFLSLVLAVLMITSTFTFNANASETSLIESNPSIEDLSINTEQKDVVTKEPELIVEPDNVTTSMTTASAIVMEVIPPTDLEKVFLVSNVTTGIGDPITITTANMFQIGNYYGDTRVVFEVSDLDFSSDNYVAEVEVNGAEPIDCYIRSESGTVGYFNVDFYEPTEGLQVINVKIKNSYSSPTVIYDTVIFNTYFTTTFTLDSLEYFNNNQTVNYRELSPGVHFYLPLEYDTLDVMFKLVNDSGTVYALNNAGRDVNINYTTVHDNRYDVIYTTSNYSLRAEAKNISTSMYCGQPLDVGSYNVDVYDYNNNLLYSVNNVLEVSSLPAVQINGYVNDFPEPYEGTVEVYCEVNLNGGEFRDFEVQLYDEFDSLVAESHGEYYLQNSYDYSSSATYKLELLDGMSLTEGSYIFKLKSNVQCVYQGDSNIFVGNSSKQIYKAIPTNFRFANIVLLGKGFDVNQQYKAVLINNDTEEVIAEKLVAPVNDKFDIEFTDTSGNVIILENETSYQVSVKERFNGEWEDYGYSSSFYNYYYGNDINMLGIEDYLGDAYFNNLNLNGYIYLSDYVIGNYPDVNNFKIVAINILGQQFVYENLTIDTQQGDGETRYYFEQPVLTEMPFGAYKNKLYYGDEEVLVDGINIYNDEYYDIYTDAPSAGQYVNEYNNINFVCGFFFENIPVIGNSELKLYDIYKSTVYPDHTINLYNQGGGSSFITNENFSGVDIYKKYYGVVYVDGKAISSNEDYYAPDDLEVDENVYSISFGPIENGALSSSIVSGTKGKLVYIFNEPIDGYQLKPSSVKVNGQPIIGRCFMLSGDSVVTAEFEPVSTTKYTIRQSDYINNGTITIDKTEAAEGELVTITANPNSNYKLSKLSYRSVIDSEYTDIDPTTNTFVMPAYDIEIYAEFSFVNSYYIRFNANDYGRIIVDESYVKEGSVVNITPEPNSGCRLVEGSVYYKINDTGEPIYINNNSFIMPSATIYIYAEFESIYTYNIIMSDMANGTVQINQTTAAAGDEVSINIIPSPGYMLKEDTLMVNGSIIPVSSYETSFIMSYENAVITCEFQLIPDTDFNISIDEYISNGTVTVNVDTASARGGDLVYVTATPISDDYKLVSLYYEYNNQSVDIVDDKFNMPSSDVKIYATFELIVYKIYSVGGYHGYTTTFPSDQAQPGQEVIVYANPYSGYEFVEGTFSYQINSVGDSIPISYINGEYRFVMPEGDVLIYADYVPIGSNSYDISYSTINNGWLYTNPSNDIAYGTNVQVSVSSRYGYKLKEGSLCYKIEGQGTSYIIENINGTYNFAMPKGNIVIYAEFEVDYGFYSINFAEITNGTISSYDDVAMPGSTVSLTVTPGTGYKLIEGSLYYKINGDGSSYPINYDPNYSSYCFTMPEGNVEIYAEFEQMGFIISTYATGKGTVTTLPANDAQSQELVEVIVQPYNGYRLVQGSLYYMIDGEYSTTYPIVDNKFFMPNSNITIYAEFESAPYNITIDSLSNGTIVSDKLTAYSNEMVTLTITPNQGYKLKDNIIKINGVDNYSYSNTYSFYMYNNDVVIAAEFVEHDILPEDKFNVNEKIWNIKPSFSPMMSNEIYSLDQGTLYVTTIIRDLDGNVVLENIETDVDNIGGYNLYKTSPIEAGNYNVEIIYGDYAKSLSIGVTNIVFGDFIDANYNIQNYYTNFTTDTRSFSVDVWIDGLFSDIENFNLKLIESETGNVVAEAVDKNYDYYDEKDNESVDSTGNNLESTNMKFDFILDRALDTEKTYLIYAVYNKEIIFGYASEIFVNSNPLILDGNISGNTITFTTECLPAGTYVANYYNIFDYNLVVDENGIGTIDMSSNPISENYANFNVHVGETVINARAQNYEIEDKHVENIVIHNSVNYYYSDTATNQYVQKLLPLTDSVMFTLNNVNEGIVSLDAYQNGNYRVVDEMEVSDLIGGEGSFDYNFDTKVVYRINVSGAGSLTFKVTDRPELSIATYQVEGYYGNTLTIPYEGSVNIDDLSKIKFICGAATGDIEFPIISYNSSEIKLDMSNAPAGIFKIRAIYPNYADGYDYDVDFSRSLSAYKVGDDSPNITALMAEGYKYYAEGVNFDKLTNAFIEIYRSVNGYLEFVKQANIIITSNTRLDVPESATSELQDGTYVLYYILDGIDKAAQVVEYTPNLSKYTVTFNSNGGSEVLDLYNVLQGTTISKPSTPIKSGYKLIGWFKDETLSEQWNFETDIVNSNITLYAKWEVAYTVQFHSMGGSKIYDYKDLQPNSLIDEPLEPNRAGYVFAGWYKDFDLTIPWNFEQDIITQNTTLYAKWNAKTYNISILPAVSDRVSVQANAKAGDIVQVTVVQDENSALQSIFWKGYYGGQSGSIDINTLSFVMPAQDIEINAYFNEMYALSVGVSKATSPYWIYVYGQNTGYSDNKELPAGTTQYSLMIPSDIYDIYVNMGENENWFWSHQAISVMGNTNVEFEIPVTYSISGKVVCTSGTLDNAYVYARSNDSSIYDYGYINSDGTYNITGLLPGEYTVTIEDWSNKYIGELNKTVVINNINVGDVNFNISKGADLRLSLSKIGGVPAFKSYVYLYKFNGLSWDYVSNAVGSGIGELNFSGAINSAGSYKVVLEYLENANYTSPRFVSEPVEFTVTEEDIAAGTIGKSLTYADPVDAAVALSGDGNIVVTNVKTARAGDFVSLEVRYKNNGNVVINPEFYINIPAGVTMDENNVFGTSLNPNASGSYKAVLYVGNVTSDIVSIDVNVNLHDEIFDFGNADISITKVTLNAPMNVKANEGFKVYGEASTGSKVMIKDAVTGQILKTVTTQGKFYTADINLPEGTAKLVAEVLLADNTTVQSKPVEVAAKSEPIEVKDVYKNDYIVGLNTRLGVHAFSEYVNMNLMGHDFKLRTEFANSSNISKVVYHFSGVDYAANSNYEAIISGWGGAGIKPITATVTTTSGEEIIFTIAEVTILIDPSGIVKNSVTGEPLADVQVLCWIQNNDGIWEIWDAENYGQSNPQLTGTDGKYGWMVPEGIYRITATKEGFDDYDTMLDLNFSNGNDSTIIIPPPRDDVNFSMNPKLYNISVGNVTGGSITVKQTSAYTDYVTVTATPGNGMKLKNILVDGVVIEGFRFEMPAKDVVVTAEFVADTYEVTGVIEYFVIDLSGQMILVKIGDVDGYAIAYSTQNELYQYLKGSNNVPIVYGIKSGNKYMLVGSSKGYALNYSLYPTAIEAMHNTDVVPDNIVSSIKVFEGFDNLGNAILTPLQ